MTTFTIDTENSIVAHAGTPAAKDVETFTSEKELAVLARSWPASRLVQIWNRFAGAADFKPVKKFTDRQSGVARIWQAVARLEPAPSPENAPRKKPAHSKSLRSNPLEAPASKKSQVIAMMRQSRGATLDAIMEVTGWQKHTVRGFLSVLGRKGGFKLDSSLNSAGLRSYKVTK